ncbi:hypothetical protein ACFL20_11570 [Spirochaetota bacterium]
MDSAKIENILLSIKDTIKSYLKDDFTLDQLKDKYSKISTEFSTLKNELPLDASYKYLQGLLYHHNVNNFSKSTFIGSLAGKQFTLLENFGNNKYASRLPGIYSENHESFHDKKVAKIILNDSENIKIVLYSMKIELNDNKFFIGAITSSNYFNIEYFHYFVEVIKKIFVKNLEINKPLAFDYSGDISTKIVDYIEKRKCNLTVNIYIFEGIVHVFGDRGITSLTETAETISLLLSENFPENSKIFTLSFNCYIVISPEEADDDPINISKIKRLDFMHKDINLHYKHRQISIDKTKPVYYFWAEILTLEKTIL